MVPGGHLMTGTREDMTMAIKGLCLCLKFKTRV